MLQKVLIGFNFENVLFIFLILKIQKSDSNRKIWPFFEFQD